MDFWLDQVGFLFFRVEIVVAVALKQHTGSQGSMEQSIAVAGADQAAHLQSSLTEPRKMLLCLLWLLPFLGFGDFLPPWNASIPVWIKGLQHGISHLLCPIQPWCHCRSLPGACFEVKGRGTEAFTLHKRGTWGAHVHETWQWMVHAGGTAFLCTTSLSQPKSSKEGNISLHTCFLSFPSAGTHLTFLNS